MFRRLFWMTVGAALGAFSTLRVARFLRRQAERYAPEQVAARAARAAQDLGGDVKAALGEGRRGMREREAELWAGLERRPPPIGWKRHDR